MTDDARKLGLIRHLQLALLLGATAEGLTIDEMAQRMEVSRRTAQRMRAALDLVFPIVALREGPSVRYRLQGHLPTSVLAPRPEELAELQLAIQSLRKEGQGERAERLDLLKSRILSALRDAHKHRLAPDLETYRAMRLPIVAAGPRHRIEPEVQDACHLALLSGSMISFDYVASSGRRRHVVAPRGVLVGARSYLVAEAAEWGEPMLFRLDRMQCAKALDEAAWPNESFDLDAYASRSFGVFQEESEEIILRFDPAISADARAYQFHPGQVMQQLSDERLEVRFVSGGLLELAYHLFQWGSAVEIIAPEALKDKMRDAIRAAASRLS